MVVVFHPSIRLLTALVSSPKTFFLIDGNGYIHRAYHALPPLTNSRGEPVQALFGFARLLQKIIQRDKPDFIAVCFDTAAPTFRHKAYSEYKAHRKEIDDALKFQLPLSKELTEAWGFPVCFLDGYEADDVIATLADKGAKAGMKVTVVTADKDALQLVDGNISVLNESKNILYDAAEVEKKYGLPPGRLVDYFALTGDASDNVPGVPGVGEKTAVPLLQKYGSLDGVFEHLDEIKESLREKLKTHRDKAFLSRDLVVLDRNAPVKMSPEECRVQPPRSPRFEELIKRLEFTALARDVSSEASPSPSAAKSSRRVHIVWTEMELKGLVENIRSAGEVTVDVETTGLNPHRCSLVGISLAVKPGEAWYIPVGHSYIGAPEQLSLDKVRKILGPLFLEEKIPKIGQNLKFDALVLRRQDLPLKNLFFDTLLASYCLNPSRMNHGLKPLSVDMLGESMTSIDELLGKGAKQITMDQVDVSKAADYAGADSEVTLRLKLKMEPELKEKGLDDLFRKIEMPLVEILMDMEWAGIRVDVDYLKKLRKTFEGEIAAVETRMRELAGDPVNFNSPKQLAVLLFDKLKLPPVRRTKTGFSTDEEVLRKLSALHPLPAKIVEFRELSKLKSTYIDALLDQAREETGRVHSSFNQAVAATGRLSSSDPNLQNIPIRTEYGRKIRRAFVPQEGWIFLSADYSQIDLRVLAHVSGDAALSGAFRRGEDIHAATAREIFGLGEDDAVSPDQRRVAKSVNFGIVYGQTPFGLSQQLGIEMARAKEYIDTYFKKYSGVNAWIKSIIEKARKDGYVITLLNRRRYLPEINAANPAVRGFAERTAMNTPIQGTSADIIKVAMGDVAGIIRRGKWKTRMLVQVHDELLFEMPPDEMAEAAPLLRSAMENAVPLDIPVVVDIKKGVNWNDMEKI